MNLIGTKQIETERLILRRLTVNDSEVAFKNWCCNPNVARYTLWDAHKSVDTTINLYTAWEKLYEKEDTFRWIVELKDTHDLIGTIDVADSHYLSFGAVEIGYCYGEDFWGKGYATEALKRVIKYLFDEVGLDVIYADHMEKNPNSGKVMKKSGMTYEGIRRGRVIDHDGIRNNLISYSITKEEYLNNIKFYD